MMVSTSNFSLFGVDIETEVSLTSEKRCLMFFLILAHTDDDINDEINNKKIHAVKENLPQLSEW